ncbi:aminodeoxychorismate synthase component I [Aliikangiella sp. IMCC44359]|uniref:aminodeoxychorismate synthase component I n=1 Tax=Aliikangiella sp. IMCC44359 TaxID=3459125 RepID=UPI00403A89B6
MNSIRLPYLDKQRKLTVLSDLIKNPWAILLDSAGENNIQFSQYDIFTYQPDVTLSFDGHHSQIDSPHQLPELVLSDPIDCLRQLLNHFKPSNKPKEIQPFMGGWMGYISYDFARNLEILPEDTVDDIQLPRIQMGLYRWALITNHQEQWTRLFNFGVDAQQWNKLCQYFKQLTQADTLKTDKKSSSKQPFQLLSQWKNNTNRQDYENAFNTIQAYILAGDCYQVNYAQRFSAQYTGSIYSAYQVLSKANQAPFSAYLNFEDHQILSLSPERFIKSEQGKIITQPIKGTRPRHPDLVTDQALANELKHSEKDKTENLMIVDLLRNDLSRTADKASVIVSELYQHYQFESVHHLISTIESRLAPQYDNFDLLKTTLPGGSITGAPKIRAMEIIEELEPIKRNLYCGVIGYIDFQGNMDTNICIRTLIAKNDHIYCWAGGGLVSDSKVDIEYQETFDKLAKILPVLNEYSQQNVPN